ncbi:hypothetical protein BGX38DRAFT_1272294 [Terfezia claveryi]|nr:hypothetical protein BGX38DRAFT_1272294 [Terfezia claveryi]
MPHVQSWASQSSTGNPILTRHPGGLTLITPLNPGNLHATVVVPIPPPKQVDLNKVHLHFTTNNAFVSRIQVVYGQQLAWDSGELNAHNTVRIDAYSDFGIGNRGIRVAFEVQFGNGEASLMLESVGLKFIASDDQ